MTALGFLLLLLIGGICGAIAEMLVGFSPGGFLASVAIGILGAFIGTWLASLLGLPSVLSVRVEGYRVEIVWAILGAVVLLVLLKLVRRTAAAPRVR